MNHGPFYHSTDLVAGVHRAEGGVFPGFRAARAYGRIYSGTFTARAARRRCPFHHSEGAGQTTHSWYRNV